jgi:hypothetical protein
MASRISRKAMARIRPHRTAFFCSSRGSLPARIVMMIRLSAPRAICTSVTENNAAQNPGSRRRSSIHVSIHFDLSTRGMIRHSFAPQILDARC